LRLRVRLDQRALDREIANGVRLETNPLLELRARQLSSTAERHAIAAGLANILDAADECQDDPASQVAVNYRPVIAARRRIFALIELLRSESAVDVRGIALARLLTQDRTGPLFRPCANGTLEQAVTEVANAM
jgi:hypothetical protein